MTFTVENNKINILCRKVENIILVRKVINKSIRKPVIEDIRNGLSITVAENVNPYDLAQTLASRTKVRIEKESHR